MFSRGKTIPIPINDNGMRLPPNRIDGKRWVAASSLDRRPAGFKLGDGYECQRLAIGSQHKRKIS